jgi:hypothetical protein
MCYVDKYWAMALLLVLSDIRSAWKKEMQASSAELIYGEHLHSSPSVPPTIPTLLTSQPGCFSTPRRSNT